MTDLVGDRGVVALVSVVSLFAVFVPLYRGLRTSLRARGATRRIKASALEGAGKVTVGDSLALLMLRVLSRSLADDGGESVPQDFVLDASKQYVMNEYAASYANVISMYANLLPPIGFIGTTSGMLILLMSMHLSDASLELGALALALTSSIFALIGFALLESLKIRLYGRLMRCLAEVTDFHLRTLAKQAHGGAR